MLLWKNHRTSRGATLGFVGQNQQFICPMPVTFSIVLIQLSVQVQSSLSLSMSGLSCFSPAPLCAFWSAFLCQYPHWFPFMMNWEVTRLKNCTTATTKIYFFFPGFASCTDLPHRTSAEGEVRRWTWRRVQGYCFQGLKCLRLLWHHTATFASGVDNK